MKSVCLMVMIEYVHDRIKRCQKIITNYIFDEHMIIIGFFKKNMIIIGQISDGIF